MIPGVMHVLYVIANASPFGLLLLALAIIVTINVGGHLIIKAMDHRNTTK